MSAGGGDWYFLAEITPLDFLRAIFALLLLFAVVLAVLWAITAWLDASEAKYFREQQAREAREFRDEFQRTKPSRPCDVCKKHPSTLYFDGVMLIDLCLDCAREAGEAGIRG